MSRSSGSRSLSRWLLVLFLVAVAGGYWAWRPGGVLQKSRPSNAVQAGALTNSGGKEDANSQFQLGQAYHEGKGIVQSYAEAAKCYRKAADQGLASAQVELGRMFEMGDGIPKDAVQAVAWYRKAAEQGDARGQYNLGLMIAKEQGAPKDFLEAYKWANLAAAQGQSSAKDLRSILERKMTPEEVAEAQRRSVAFVPRKNP